MKPSFNRRTFLKLSLLAPALPLPAWAQATAERRLSLHNLHTGERVDLPYWIGGSYVADSLADISRVLRDHRTGQIAAIDPALLDLLHRVNLDLGASHPFEIISGYRSPASNRMLTESSAGVARRSLHMEGKAIDIRLPGVALADLRLVALSLKAGGVGYYPESNFVHLDVGRVRTWGG